MWGLLHGELGTSLFYRTPITKEIGPRIPATLELAVPLGAVSAVKQDSLLDYGARMVTFAGISIPIFVTGLVVYLLVRLFNWFPPLGYATLWEAPWTNLQQMVFPTLALAFFELNFTARAKGLTERRVLLRHALQNAALPILTVSAWSLARLLGGRSSSKRSFSSLAWGCCCSRLLLAGTTP